MQESQDSNLHRPGRLEPLKKRYLTPTAVPSVFPNLPSYLSKPAPQKRSESATSAARQKREEEKRQEEERRREEADQVQSPSDLQKKLDTQTLPNDFEVIYKDDTAIFLQLSLQDSQPIVSKSLTIDSSLSFSLWREGVEVPIRDAGHIAGLGKISKCSEVPALLSFLKDGPEKVENTVEYCVSLLENLLSEENASSGKLRFLVEQLRLLGKRPHQKRYSPMLLASCVLWENTSPNLYRQMVEEDLLSLPSAK